MREGGSLCDIQSNFHGSFPRIMSRMSLGSCSPHKALLLSKDARRKPPAHAQASYEQVGCSYSAACGTPSQEEKMNSRSQSGLASTKRG